MRERTTRVEFLGRGVGRETRVNCVPGSGLSRALRRKDLEMAGAMGSLSLLRIPSGLPALCASDSILHRSATDIARISRAIGEPGG